MANEALQIYKKLGLKEESTWAQGTVTPATELLDLRENGIAIGFNPQLIRRATLGRGRASYNDTLLGTHSPKVAIPFFGEPKGSGLVLLKAAFGQVTSTEQTSFTVSATNKHLDINEGSGALLATIAEGSYAAGTTSATGGTLCAAIKTALDAAGDLTYTVAYSYTTKKFTISATGTFSILWNTGANKATAAAALLGYATTADDASAATYTSDTATEIVFQHVFSFLEANTYGMSAGLTLQIMLATGKVYDVLDCAVDSLGMRFVPNQELQMDAGIEARKFQDSGSTLAGLSAPSQSVFTYDQLVFQVGGASKSLKALDINLSNEFKKDLYINSQYRSRFPRGGPRQVSGTFTYDLADSEAYSILTSQLAGSTVALTATWTGTTAIKGSSYNSMAVSIPQAFYKLEDVPGGGGMDAPDAPIPFIAEDDGTNGEIKITVQNNVSSV